MYCETRCTLHWFCVSFSGFCSWQSTSFFSSLLLLQGNQKFWMAEPLMFLAIFPRFFWRKFGFFLILSCLAAQCARDYYHFCFFFKQMKYYRAYVTQRQKHLFHTGCTHFCSSYSVALHFPTLLSRIAKWVSFFVSLVPKTWSTFLNWLRRDGMEKGNTFLAIHSSVLCYRNVAM